MVNAAKKELVVCKASAAGARKGWDISRRGRETCSFAGLGRLSKKVGLRPKGKAFRAPVQ